jgi:DNA-directed RNA polymerase specialized sigma24 family protein
MIRRKDNPAKVFLRRYIALSGRVDALSLAISQAMERALNTGISLKEVKVLSSPAEHDPMARDVVNAIDSCEVMYKYKAEAETALREILSAIDSLTDERQKEILTMRYIAGLPFREIQEKIHYEATQMYVIHGRALIGINRWLNEHGYGSEG